MSISKSAQKYLENFGFDNQPKTIEDINSAMAGVFFENCDESPILSDGTPEWDLDFEIRDAILKLHNLPKMTYKEFTKINHNW